jgi:hypothetical protein
LTTGFGIELKLHAVLKHSYEPWLQSLQQKYAAVTLSGLKFKIVFMLHFIHFNHVTSQKAKNSDSKARDNVNMCETDICMKLELQWFTFCEKLNTNYKSYLQNISEIVYQVNGEV